LDLVAFSYSLVFYNSKSFISGVEPMKHLWAKHFEAFHMCPCCVIYK